MNATIKQLRAQVERINQVAKELNLLEGEKWVEGIPGHLVGTAFEYPHLYLEEGTQTYGRAWRLVGVGGSKYQTGTYDVFHLGNGYVGWTKNETSLSLRMIYSSLEHVSNKAREANAV
jgi:hypothetical protein